MNIFIIEDDSLLLDALRDGFSQWSYEVNSPNDFSHVMNAFAEHRPHLVIIDIQLPKFDGFHWCREIRAVSKVPLKIMVIKDN
ncbi:response regulator [Salibacterium aidingense]|uniref:response regulator n=1 Tax=Salibacterium aidingense TaxID=384933 RepID=UPI0004015900|nr:response regulator [Salibacterium aidingense]